MEDLIFHSYPGLKGHRYFITYTVETNVEFSSRIHSVYLEIELLLLIRVPV